MKRIATLFAIALALAATTPARAASEYVLEFTNYNPYYTEVVGGPFPTSQECYAILGQEGYRPGGSYSCRSIYVPG